MSRTGNWTRTRSPISVLTGPDDRSQLANHYARPTNVLCRNDRPMPLPSLVNLSPRAPENRSVKVPQPTEIARRKRAQSLITQPWIIQFRSNFAQSLNAWHSKCCKSSSSRCQRSRSQRAKIRKIINNSNNIRFRSNLAQTLITWRLMYHELSRSTGQMSR